MVVGLMGIGIHGTPVGERIDVVSFSADGASVTDVSAIALPMPAGRLRSVVLGPEGDLDVAVDQGDSYRLSPK
jgi:hypothetical protein